MTDIGPVVSSIGLDKIGLGHYGLAHWNLPRSDLYTHALQREEAQLSDGGALVAETGIYTGRSPKDKFIVERDSIKDEIWWGDVNQPIAPAFFDRIFAKFQAYIQERELFVQDLHGGCDTDHQINVRVVTEEAWHSLFAQNMLVRPALDQREDFDPDYTVVQMPGLKLDPATDGTLTDVGVILDLEKNLVLIAGTAYAGEIKKSVFSILNYLLPAKGIMAMHCSANVGDDGRSAIFFGLSGTGKTTLSADSSRTLIGDDEHGWSDTSLFNFEGGCYAKTIKLSAEQEPEIHAASTQFGTVLENVVLDPNTGLADFDDGSLTENTRSSYPIDFIPNASKTGVTSTPKVLIMLTADAFGVLPPISKLTPAQAMYQFISGYTAKLAGTERGITEPEATFSACFGAPFMPRHPSVYAQLLGKKVAENQVSCWLVNTGWSGGAYGYADRISLSNTRAMVEAALSGQLDDVETKEDSIFGLHIPVSCPGVDSKILTPRDVWHDASAYDKAAKNLAALFEENFKAFEDQVSDDIKAIAIRA